MPTISKLMIPGCISLVVSLGILMTGYSSANSTGEQQGADLAAKYHGDVGIEKDEAVILIEEQRSVKMPASSRKEV